MQIAGTVSSILLLLLVECAARPFYPLPSRRNDRSKQPLQTFRPYNIAHRGSSGEFPEETASAYKRAIEEGADFIETDILASKDGILICFHDLRLDATTDIAQHKKFESRKRTYEVQGKNITGYFTSKDIMTFSSINQMSMVLDCFNFLHLTFVAFSLLWCLLLLMDMDDT